jgi:hypothetical protein
LVTVGGAFLVAMAIGVGALAEDEGEADVGPPPPPGVPESGAPAGSSSPTGRLTEAVTTGGTNYDLTILTKFISGPGFAIQQGTDPYEDAADYTGSASPTCVRADTAAPAGAGAFIDLNASVELPDGARIKQIRFYGQNSDPTETILVRLHRVRLTVPITLGAVTRSNATVDSFSVPAGSGVTAILGADDLEEVTGSQLVSPATGTEHNFHTVRVRMTNAAGPNHRLCGVEVDYQVPATANPGSVFHPLTGYRAYDSRLEMAPVADGPLGDGPGRVIPVKDGRDVSTGAINLPDAIPASATAVAYTVTAAGPSGAGFLFVGPGDATEITASNLNWASSAVLAIANSGIVQLDAEREVVVFAGGAPGVMTNFIIDITGYYAPIEFPNMGN